MDNQLSFKVLREANLRRLPLFKNAKGEIAHKLGDVADWSIADWVVAIVGELGELSNVFKKIRRGDFTQEEVQSDIEKEMADVQCYLDLLASRCGVELGAAVIFKFNEVSDRIDVPIKIDLNGRTVYNQDLDATTDDHR